MVQEAPVADRTKEAQACSVRSGNVFLEAAATAIDLAADATLEVDLLGVRAEVHCQAQFSLEGFPALWTELLLSSFPLNAMNEDPVCTKTAIKLEETATRFTAVFPP